MISEMFKLDLEKAEEDIKLPTPVGSSKKQVKKKEKEKASEFQENVYFCFILPSILDNVLCM